MILLTVSEDSTYYSNKFSAKKYADEFKSLAKVFNAIENLIIELESKGFTSKEIQLALSITVLEYSEIRGIYKPTHRPN